MKDHDFKPDKPVPFKVLAGMIKGFTDGTVDEDDFDLDEFIRSGVVDRFEKVLSEELSKPFEAVSEDEIYEEIVENYCLLIKELGIDRFSFFRFAAYDDCRNILVDGKAYDLDGEFCHDDEEATGALCAIDCLMADLDEEESKTEAILKEIELRINVSNQK